MTEGSSSMDHPTSVRGSLLLPVIMMLIAMPTLVGLGVWQWQRLGEKEALIARIEARSKVPPQNVTLKELLSSGLTADQLDYTPVQLTGRFLNAAEAHVFTNLDQQTGAFGGPGYDVLTPFLAEGGGVVLVDRGFVPGEKRAPATRAAGRSEDRLAMTGIVRRPERRTYLDVADAPEKNVFAIRDPRTILAAKHEAVRDAPGPIVDAFYIELRDPVPQGGLPQPLQTGIAIPNNHLQYAFTWWALALVFAGMFALFLRSSSQNR